MAYTTIDDPTVYFNTLLYTGNGSARSITGVGFQPDWVWVKVRSQAHNHYLYDAVRGAQEKLSSNTTAAEIDMGSDGLTAFNADGFSMGTDTDENASGQTYVSWNWKAGGSASSNSDGSITSTVSANTTAGFSIVSYTGTGSNATVGHGLGVAPKAIIIKQRSIADGWVVFFPTLDITLALHSTIANNHSSKFSSFFNSTDPTSTLISLGTDDQTNKSSATNIAYCFAEKKGYSKFGSYTGNGNADGTFVFCGFRPAFVMTKRTDTTSAWDMFDNKREGYNPDNDALFANLTNAEDATDRMDLVSNGFKMRISGGSPNYSSGSYIYMAFGQTLVGSNNIPSTAR